MPRSWNAALEDPAPLCRPRNPIKSKIGQCVVFKIPSFALYLGAKPMEGEEPSLTPHQTSGQIRDHHISEKTSVKEHI